MHGAKSGYHQLPARTLTRARAPVRTLPLARWSPASRANDGQAELPPQNRMTMCGGFNPVPPSTFGWY